MTSKSSLPRFPERSGHEGAEHSPGSKTGLRALNALAFEALKLKHPEIKAEWLPWPKYRDATANQLTQSIIMWIRLNGGQAERISVSGRTIDHRQVVTDCLGNRRMIGSLQWIPGTMTRGSADISATVKGRSLKVEVKIGRDRQSDAQRQYQRSIEAAGGVYVIARDFQGFYEWFTDYFRDFQRPKTDKAVKICGEHFQENRLFQ
ncbi:MAG: hypothetical protein M0Q38_15490 [Bacteroidales bacterium]|jgi:hypothetical protein|nr:hypothetical protein [Bacteroidales bacterium]